MLLRYGKSGVEFVIHIFMSPRFDYGITFLGDSTKHVLIMNVRLLSSNLVLLQPRHIDMISIILLFITLVFGCIAAKKNIETTTEVPQQEQRCIPKSPEIIILESGH